MIFTILVSVWGASVLLMVAAFGVIELAERFTGVRLLDRVAAWLVADDPNDEL